MVQIHPKRIHGKWKSGIALDVHTVSSVYLGPDEFGRDQFDTKRSKLGELLYRLKYLGDASEVPAIVETACNFLKTARGVRFDLIVPVPASKKRNPPPVLTVARGIGETLGIAVADCVVPSRETAPLKDVNDPAERAKLLQGLYTVDASLTRGKKLLLFDDLFRSGATMNAITEVLYQTGEAADVRALALTCTRSKL
jgi:predicted amidophosphoribosyltransferase